MLSIMPLRTLWKKSCSVSQFVHAAVGTLGFRESHIKLVDPLRCISPAAVIWVWERCCVCRLVMERYFFLRLNTFI